jgi:hypothetical protein
MPGLSSPAFAPNGRTIAFVRPGIKGDEIWMTAADGSDVKPVATLTFHGDPLAARVSGLAWSPDGDRIAFALNDGVHDLWTGGSAIWQWNLATGRFAKAEAGFPAPLWIGKKLAYPLLDEDGTRSFEAGRWDRWTKTAKTADGSILGTAYAPSTWFNTYKHGAVMLRETGEGELELAVKSLWKRNAHEVFGPPPGHDFVRVGQPALSTDGTRAFVDLVDAGGERDLGELDVLTGEWEVRDYAWEPSVSPAPATTGQLTERKVHGILETMLGGLGRARRLTLLGIDAARSPVPPGKRVQFTYQDPTHSGGDWSTTASVLRYESRGRLTNKWTFRTFGVELRLKHGRVVAELSNVGPWVRIDSLEDAYSYAEAAVGRGLPRPTLPADLKLDLENPVNAWTWSGRTTVNLSFLAPNPSARRAAIYGPARTTVSYGDDVSLSLGCGGVGDPEPIDIGGPPAVYDELKPTRAIVWPATPKHAVGRFGVSGDLSAESVEAIARSMVTQ